MTHSEPDCPNLEDENGDLGVCTNQIPNLTDEGCCPTILMKRILICQSIHRKTDLSKMVD